jgi:hypothetical protein
MLNPVVTPAFRRLLFALCFTSCAFTMILNAQPAPQISGEKVVCPDAEYFYATPYTAGNTYDWVVSSGGVITQSSNNFIAVKWTGPQNSTQSVSVTEGEPSGASGTAQITVLIKKTLVTCANIVHVSIDQSGVALIKPEMLLSGTYNSYVGFNVVVSIPPNNPIGNTLNCSHIGMNLTGKVTDECTGNSCWSIIKLEDKKAPLFDCPVDPVEIPCDTNLDNYPAPSVVDNCDIYPTVNLVGMQVNNSNICNGVTVTKQWVAVDDYGNESTCTQQLYIDSNNEVDFPDDRFWPCEDYNAHPNVINPTVFTGNLTTTGSGIPLGASGPYCQSNFIFHDDTLDACGNTFKIIRTWTVINWCTGQVILTDSDGDDNEQIIKIIDQKKPTISVPAITLSANIQGSLPIFCASTGLLPAPTVSDGCGGVTVRIFTSVGEANYVNGVNGNEGGYVPQPGLKIGNNTVIYRATDDCGNETEIPVNAVVVDNTPPTAICDEFTAVTLDVFGFAEVFATTFDDGSHDNCCIDHMEVKRMGEPDWAFAPSMDFTCEDDTVMVVFRVYDCFNNHNDCMVSAIVKDKIAPTCIAPPQKIINCTEIPGDITQTWLNGFGYPSVNDNCNATITELPWAENINACGEGHVIRFFAAVDDSGNISGTCEQHIYVVPKSDWLIEFPANWYGDCGDTINAPTIKVSNFGCDMFAVSHEDQFFALGSDSACFKIVRTWKIINWCYYDPYVDPIKIPTNPLGVNVDETTYNNFGRYEYQQILKIHDTTPPVLSYPFVDEFCSMDTACATGYASVPVQIDGECSNAFEIVYHLDLNNDQTYELSGTGYFEGTVPIGNHRILYLVTDGCSNQSTKEILFKVKDCKKPAPICENGLIVEIMQTGMIEVCAKSFNYGSYDNCPGPLKFSFSADTGDSCRTFVCTQTYFQLPIKMWVTDAAGNQDYCETFLTIQDNMFSCDTGIPITGALVNEAQNPLQGANVQLNSNMGAANFTTGQNGQYEFTGLDAGQDYTITPAKNDDPLNGVTTFDLVIMSRHILGIQLLNSPYKMIAADVNNSKSITTFDLVELRKLVLFINTSFPNNTSWRFVKKSYQFPNPANPWQEMFPEVINLNNLSTAVSAADFISIKIGDVNGSASTQNLHGSAGDRSADMLMFETDALTLQPGEVVPVTLRAKDFDQVYGFQFTLDFDPQALEFQNVVPTAMTNAQNFGLSLLDQGAVTTSWFEINPVTMSDGEAVITLNFKVKTACDLKSVIGISSRFTQAEAYVGEDMSVWEVGVDFSGVVSASEIGSTGFELYQNVPNPFSQKTAVGFRLPKASKATLTVYDLTGRMVTTIEGEYPAGFNEIQLSRQALPADGLLFYRLETPEFTATRSMTLVSR